MADKDFKELVAENKRQTGLLNKIAGVENDDTQTVDAVNNLRTTLQNQGKDANRVAAGEKAWQTRQENAQKKADKIASSDTASGTEDKNEQKRSFLGILEGLQSVKKGILGLPGSIYKKGKDSAGKGFSGFKKMLAGLAIGGALAGFVAFMNSPYWEKTKAFINDTILPAIGNLYENIIKPLGAFFMDEIVPALGKVYDFFVVTMMPILKNLYDNILEPLGVIIKDTFLRSWENIKEFFSGIGEAIELFASGDILGGINATVNALGGLILNSIDNILTSIAALFGFEGDSIGAAIGQFFVDLKDGVVNFFTVTVPEMISKAIATIGEFLQPVFNFFDDMKAKVVEALGDFALFQFVQDVFGDLFSSIKGIFSGDFSTQNFLDLFGSLMDIVFYPVNLAVNAIKDIFGFGDPDEPFRLSDFVIETFAKIGEFFKSLLDIDVRGLASGILPETVVDFLFGKKVDQDSDEFKAMSAIEQAEATGLYDKDLIGNSELNQNLLGGASDAQLQAILDDDDISEENIKAIKAEQAKRSGVGEFSGSGQYEEKKLNAYERKMQRIENKRGDMINQSSQETAAEKERARQNIQIVNQQVTNANQAPKSGQQMTPMPIPTKDISSAAQAAATGGY